MKKLFAMMMCGTLIFSLAACGNAKDTQQAPIGGDPSTWGPALNTEDKTDDLVEIPSPFIDCNTMADASQISGFDLETINEIAGYSEQIIQATEKEMVQVIFKNNENTVVIRKGISTSDISGDYRIYDVKDIVDVDGKSVSISGNKENKYLATWTDSEYSYSISVDTGMDVDSLLDIIKVTR